MRQMEASSLELQYWNGEKLWSHKSQHGRHVFYAPAGEDFITEGVLDMNHQLVFKNLFVRVADITRFVVAMKAEHAKVTLCDGLPYDGSTGQVSNDTQTIKG